MRSTKYEKRADEIKNEAYGDGIFAKRSVLGCLLLQLYSATHSFLSRPPSLLRPADADAVALSIRDHHHTTEQPTVLPLPYSMGFVTLNLDSLLTLIGSQT